MVPRQRRGSQMAIETLKKSMAGDGTIALSKKHSLFEWSAQSEVDEMPVAWAKECAEIDALRRQR